MPQSDDYIKGESGWKIDHDHDHDTGIIYSYDNVTIKGDLVVEGKLIVKEEDDG